MAIGRMGRVYAVHPPVVSVRCAGGSEGRVTCHAARQPKAHSMVSAMDAIVVSHARGRLPSLASSPGEAAPDGLLLRTVVFRFVCVYFVLYGLPWPLGWIPRTEPLAQRFAEAKDWLLLRAGELLLQSTERLGPVFTGSGDTLRQWLWCALLLAAAAATTVLWSLFDRRRAHPRLYDLLRTWLRYLLALTMLGYGTEKFLDGQFPAIRGDQLATPWGECSPMGVLWRFLGASAAYTAAAGLAECLGGLLLLWRRTSLAGALVTAAVTSHVVLLNFCYDLPVKLHSTHLLLMAIVIAWRDVGRLLAVLWHHRAVAAAPLRLPTPWWWFWPARLVKLAVVGWLLFGAGRQLLENWHDHRRPFGPLHGTYEVESFARDGVEVPPLLTDAGRWGQVVVQDRVGPSRSVTVWLVDLRGQRLGRFDATVDDGDGRLTLHVPLPAGIAGPPSPSPFRVEALANGGDGAAVRGFRLEGAFDGTAVRATLRERPREQRLLLSRGFHWVQDYPCNR